MLQMRRSRWIYAVDITTQQGDCDKAYHWMISVSGGHVSAAGDTPMKASGQISPRGTVDLAFQRFGQVATVTGRFARGYGSGSGPRRPCDAPVRGGHSGKANY
jgi:hypothetical protein